MNETGVAAEKPAEPETRQSIRSTEAKEKEDEDEIPGNQLKALGDMGNSIVSFEQNQQSDGEEEQNPEEARFGHSEQQFDRGTLFFKNAQKRNQDMELTDYLLNHEIRKLEDPNREAEAADFQKALFYMYGHCKDVSSGG